MQYLTSHWRGLMKIILKKSRTIMFKRSVYNKQGILYYAYRDVIDMNGQRSLSFCYFVIFSSRRQWRQQKHFQNQAPIHFRNINLIKPVPSLIQVYIYIYIHNQKHRITSALISANSSYFAILYNSLKNSS